MKLIDIQDVRTNMLSLIQFASDARDPIRCERKAYFESLNRTQQYQIRVSTDEEPLLDFSPDHPTTRSLLGSLQRSPDFENPNNVRPVLDRDVGAIAKNLQHASLLLQRYCPELAQIFKDLVSWIIVIDKEEYFGGSFWYALGAIWISPHANWHVTDYAENLLHETVHQALFLDDMVRGLFAVSSSELSADSALVTSSIRRTKRPYDYAFHGAAVCVSLLDFHENCGDSAHAIELCTPLIGTLVELDEKRHFLSPRGGEVLEDMMQCVAASRTVAALQAAPS
jgi:hypothetical protein